MGKLILSITLFIYSLASAAQARNYNVLLGDKKVGTVVASKTISGDKITYTTDFKIRIRLFKLFDIESITTSEYQNDILLSTNMTVYDDGELDEEKNIKKENSLYRCTDCEDNPIVAKKAIYTNVSKVYFVEPILHQEVYTERYLNFGKMTTLDNHKYKYEMPNGDENIYTYKNGKLESIDVKRFLYHLTFKYVD
jgi:hypothetical protein